MSTPQRLVVCLDGTWNNRNDGTHVVHHYNLVREGPVTGRNGQAAIQRRYYDPGVGTGVLDRITGGGFGFGLDENVREAYDWLAETYQDGDEIFVFGFSRGAYTARSLVGFIGRCGLLRRGSPLPINQLWQAYCVIGRQREQRATWLERLSGEGGIDMREITQLVRDPWDDDPSRPIDQPRSETEELLVRWSRRVPIQFLGVYDTVGALGWDALAIPGLRSHLALHHNMRPTSLIQHCRHALALDEHRSSFHHTPFLAYSGHGGKGTEAEQEAYWADKDQKWRDRIEQCWFVGAHANIGGGYECNRLGARPFTWLLEGAEKAGLVCEPLHQPAPVPSPLPRPRDSFAEFARPLWTMLLRAKRTYRRIDPPPQAHASPHRPVFGHSTAPGYSLCPINESVDATVWSYYAKDAPPNLAEYAQRKKKTLSAPAPHRWIGDGFLDHAALAFLAVFAAPGVLACLDLFFPGLSVSASLHRWLALVPVLFVGVDWAESRVSWEQTRNGSRPTTRAFRDSIYWTRALGVALCVIGLVYLLGACGHTGATAASRAGLQEEIAALLRRWALPAGTGAAAVLVALALDGADAKRWRAAPAALLGGLAAWLAAPLVMTTAFYLARLLAPLLPAAELKGFFGSGEGTAFAGALLLVQIGLLYLVRAFSWCGEPMANRQLGSVVGLQLRATAHGVKAQLDTWRRQLACPWRDRDPQHNASTQMRATVAEALARDMVGFVPVYFATLLFGLWFCAAADQGLHWEWLRWRVLGMELWFALPITALVADYFEDLCHVLYLWADREGKLDAGWLRLLVPVSFLASLLKLFCFASAAGTAFVAVAVATVCLPANAGWRAVPVVLISAGGALVLLALVIGIAFSRRQQSARERAAAAHVARVPR